MPAATKQYRYVGPPAQRIVGLSPQPGDTVDLDAKQARQVEGNRWFQPLDSKKKDTPTVE